MALATIYYNASTGSDLNGGGNAPTSAVTGTNGDCGGTTLTLNETKDFTGVADDGTDVLWYDGNAGDRHLFTIASFNPSVAACTTITTTQTFTGIRTASNWGVGGLRKTLQNDSTRNDLQEAQSGWTFEFATGTYTSTTFGTIFSVGSLADGPMTVQAASGATVTLDWTYDGNLFQINGGYLEIEGVTLSNTTSTSTTSQCIETNGAATFITARNCTFVSPGPIACTAGRWIVSDCNIKSTTVDSAFKVSSAGHATVIDCLFYDCGGRGIDAETTADSVVVSGSVFHDCVGVGLFFRMGGAGPRNVVIANNVIHGSSNNGIHLQNASPDISQGPISIYNNIITDNSAYGIDCDADLDLLVYNDFNAFRGNTSGEMVNLTKGANSVTLTADPYLDEANDDYTLNDTAGGGAACKDVGFGYPVTATTAAASISTVANIVYDSSVGKGSDTAASGSNRPTTAVTGTNGDISGTTVTLNATLDFTGVFDDGKDILWYEGNAGDRHLFTISSFNPSVIAATTLTVDQTATGARTASNWAVGGIRSTLDNDTSNPDIDDGEAGWVFQLNGSGEYCVAATSTISTGSLAAGPVTVQAEDGETPKITWTGDIDLFDVSSAGYAVFKNLILENTTTTSTNARCVHGSSGFIQAIGCTMTAGYALFGSGGRTTLVDCEITGTQSFCLRFDGAHHGAILGCVIRSNDTSGGIWQNGTGAGSLTVSGCIIRDIAGAGIQFEVEHATAYSLVVSNNIFHGCVGDGIFFTGAANIARGPLIVTNNIFTDNGGHGMDVSGGTSLDLVLYNDYNAFRGNTGGEVHSDITKGANSITLTADPYSNAATDDYRLNYVTGGGSDAQSVGLGYDG